MLVVLGKITAHTPTKGIYFVRFLDYLGRPIKLLHSYARYTTTTCTVSSFWCPESILRWGVFSVMFNLTSLNFMDADIASFGVGATTAVPARDSSYGPKDPVVRYQCAFGGGGG